MPSVWIWFAFAFGIGKSNSQQTMLPYAYALPLDFLCPCYDDAYGEGDEIFYATMKSSCLKMPKA